MFSHTIVFPKDLDEICEQINLQINWIFFIEESKRKLKEFKKWIEKHIDISSLGEEILSISFIHDLKAH